MKRNQIFEQLKQIIVEDMSMHWIGTEIHENTPEIHENTPLFEGGLAIDSVGIVELIALIEENFQVEFAEEELTPENFSDLRRITDLLAKKQSEKMSHNLAQTDGIS